jgi:predicted ATPase
MITKVHIQNFKSVEDLTVELGQVNVIIGANGTGKSNILEGIAMGAAGTTNPWGIKYEHISSRIRAIEHHNLVSGFENSSQFDPIKVDIESDQFPRSLQMQFVPKANDGKEWVLLLEFEGDWPIELMKSLSEKDKNWSIFLKRVADPDDIIGSGSPADLPYLYALLPYSAFSDFLIYAPENTYLRKFEESGQITPLGLRGEGLFSELKQIFTRPEKAEQLSEIKEHLELFEWYEDMELPNGLLSMEYRLSIKDRYRAEGLEALDQRSANEGFLFWLFYLVLFTSEHTPRFFAIDNIETAFNPILCTEVMIRLTQLAKKHGKQVIFTTHNPAILDGIDLKDNQQRLFIARRGKKGQTLIERLEHKPQGGMKLSELWTKGYIGGIPSNF